MTAQTSIDAYLEKLPDLIPIRERVMDVVEAAGLRGTIGSVVENKYPDNAKKGSIRPRFVELESEGQIFRVIRNGVEETRTDPDTNLQQTVWRHRKYASEMGIELPTSPIKKAKTYKRGISDGIKLAIKEVLEELSPDAKKKLRRLYEKHK